MRRAERPMPFQASLPEAARRHCWLPVLTVTLTLALPDGEQTAFEVRECRQTHQRAHNVSATRMRPPASQRQEPP